MRAGARRPLSDRDPVSLPWWVRGLGAITARRARPREGVARALHERAERDGAVAAVGGDPHARGELRRSGPVAEERGPAPRAERGREPLPRVDGHERERHRKAVAARPLHLDEEELLQELEIAHGTCGALEPRLELGDLLAPGAQLLGEPAGRR